MALSLGSNQAKEFISRMVTLIPFFYIEHWATSRFVVHDAMSKSQEEFPAILDKLVEAYQGKIGMRLIGVKSMPTSSQDSKLVITEALNYIRTNRINAFGEDSSLQNVVDELIGQLNTTLDRISRT